MIMTNLDSSKKLVAVFLMIIDQSIVDFAISGAFLPSLLDIAPQYSGTLSGISTTFSFSSSILAPILAARMTKHVCINIHNLKKNKTFIIKILNILQNLNLKYL